MAENSMSRKHHHPRPPPTFTPPPTAAPQPPDPVTIVPDILLPIARLKSPDGQEHVARGVIPIAFRVNHQGCTIMDLRCTEQHIAMLRKEGVTINTQP